MKYLGIEKYKIAAKTIKNTTVIITFKTKDSFLFLYNFANIVIKTGVPKPIKDTSKISMVSITKPPLR